MDRSEDPLRYVLGRPLIAPPGVSWRYNGGTTQVVAAIVQRATKQPLVEYARDVLFSPLGITDFEWMGRLAGLRRPLPACASGRAILPSSAPCTCTTGSGTDIRLCRATGSTSPPGDGWRSRNRRERLRVSVVVYVLSHAVRSRRSADRGGERHAARVRPARPADRGDDSVWQVQRFQRQSAGASVARLHYSGVAAGAEVPMPVMTLFEGTL